MQLSRKTLIVSDLLVPVLLLTILFITEPTHASGVAQADTQTKAKEKSGSNVALDVLTTARAKEYCYAGASDDLLDDLRAYMTLNRVPLSNAVDVSYTLSVIVDRPMSKHIELTVQARDSANVLLWTDTVIWGEKLTPNDTVRVLDRIHEVINAKLRTLQAAARIN